MLTIFCFVLKCTMKQSTDGRLQLVFWEMEVEVGEELLTCATDDVLKYSKYAGTQKVMKYSNKRRAKCKQRYLILSGIFRVALNFFSNRRKEYHNACHAKTGSVFVFTYHSDRH